MTAHKFWLSATSNTSLSNQTMRRDAKGIGESRHAISKPIAVRERPLDIFNGEAIDHRSILAFIGIDGLVLVTKPLADYGMITCHEDALE
ncbi:hypothetical protein [uncultured Cohaesibacter sp.]|uniref:hypothetical protein n=1 Tax=uncultured Cohaesibacter sp. TaxID=1002546 RepID=UPI0029C725E5|nr:hypothetical protein [uncultured Cohaesibacter sp.]